MLDQSHNSNCCIWFGFVISDLYLLHDIVLLNPCFNFSKNSMISSIDKVTTGTYSLVLIILKSTLGLLWCSSIHKRFSTVNQALHHSSSKVNQETSKNC